MSLEKLAYDGRKAEADIRAKNPGCTFPSCMCRRSCAIAAGDRPWNGNPFERQPFDPFNSYADHEQPKG